jgi:hypothetical protein
MALCKYPENDAEYEVGIKNAMNNDFHPVRRLIHSLAMDYLKTCNHPCTYIGAYCTKIDDTVDYLKDLYSEVDA